MGVEFVEKIHEQIYLQCADTENDVFLRLGPVAAVISSRLLSLHPQVDQLLELARSNTRCETQTRPPTTGARSPSACPHLQGQHHQSHADHDDHQQLGGPYPRGDVAKADGGEGDDAEVERVEEGEVLACPFQVLDPACAGLSDVRYFHFGFRRLYLLNRSINVLRCKMPHPVKTRQSSVQIRMRTWLNMAELVLWMALWTSFYPNSKKDTDFLERTSKSILPLI